MGLEHAPPFLTNLILIVVGLCLGSFATALAHRVPIGKKMGGLQRSACTHCGHELKPIDLIPLGSWLSTAGKCRYCGKDIGISYPLIELGVLLACMITFWERGWSVDTLFIIAAVPFLAALLVIDLRHMILPNTLLLVLAGIGLTRMFYRAIFLGMAPTLGQWIEYALDIATFAGIAWLLGFITEKILKKEALGMGDVKFFAMAGLWLGLSQLGWFCTLSGLFGVLFAGIFKKYYKSGHFPFGPALIAALFLLVLTEGSLFQ